MAQPRLSSSAHVTTFYSFKGGVGRSLLLANVGWLLAARRRVVLWDLDVEAPGLHRVPALRPPEVRRGFFEWLGEWKGAAALAEKKVLEKRDAKALAKLVLPVPGRANLSILPAYGDGGDFARLYAEGPWRRFLVDEPGLGLTLFDAVLLVLSEGRDHVLLDSRTGITDLGGFLAALLPHATVLVGGYGHQSLHGLLHVKEALAPAVAGKLAPRDRLGAGARLQLLHAVSPVPDDVEESSERRRVWAEVFNAVRPIEVPFDRRLLWSEHLLAKEDPEGAAGRAYAEVAERLAGLRDELLARSEAVTTDAARDPRPEARLEPFGPRRGLAFEERVKRLLELHGYSVEPKQLLGGNEVDLVARKTGGLDEECWWVECKDHKQPVRKEVLETLFSWVDGREGKGQGARGMVVAREFTPAASSLVKDQPRLRALTVDELERRLFDPRPYLHGLVTAFEQSPLARTYVEQQVLLEGKPEEEATVDLLAHAVAWANGDGPRLWLLLGDYGTGKSAFFQRFAAELARRALADSEAPFPLAIDLKLVPNATTAETLLFDHLRQRAPSLRVDPAVLLHLLAAGRCVLLLDAFDEMGVAAAGRSVEEQFRELARLSGEEPLEPRRGSRVLVTCRTHFFRDQQQVKDVAASRPAGLVAVEDSALGRVARRFNAEIDEIRLFGDEQIAEFLEKHLGAADAARAREFIAETYDLPTLAPRPVLLEMIVRSLPALWKEGTTQVTPAGLYEIYTRQWLEDNKGKHLQTGTVLRHRLLGLLAAALWRREDRQIHHRELLEEVRQLSEHFPGFDYDRVDVELRTAAFLVRSADGYYRFSHKSFLEYFLARGLWEKLGAGGEMAAAALDLPKLSPEVGEFFWQLPDGGREERLAILREILQATYRARVSENAVLLGVWGGRALDKPFGVGNADLRRALLPGEDLRGVQLPAANLTGAELGGANFDEADLTGALLDGANLENVTAVGTNLSAASLVSARFLGADLSHARFGKARLEGAILRGACLNETDFSGASLFRVSLERAWGDGVKFSGTDLRRACLADSVWTRSHFGDANFDEATMEGWLIAGEESMPAGILPGRLAGLEARVEILWRRRSFIQGVSWSSDGESIAVGSWEGTVRVWDQLTGELSRELSCPGERSLSISWSPKGKELAVGRGDGMVQIWQVSEGRLVGEFPGLGGSVWSVAWSPSGGELATAGEDGVVRVWDLLKGVLVLTLFGSRAAALSVAWSPSGKELALGSADGAVYIWKVATGNRIGQLSGSPTQRRVWSVAWSPLGELMASASLDGAINIWDVATGKLARVLSGEGPPTWSLSWSPSGEELAAGSDDGVVRVWEASTGRMKFEIAGSRGNISWVSWSPGGRTLALASTDGGVRLWDVSTGKSMRELADPGLSISSVAWSRTGGKIALGNWLGAVQIWEVLSGLLEQRLSISSTGEWPVAWSPTREELATGALSNSVAVWNVSSGALIRTLLAPSMDTVLSISWSPSGEEMAAGSSRGMVWVWEVSKGALVQELSGLGNRISAVSWSPTKRELAVRSGDGGVRIWDLSAGRLRRELSVDGPGISAVSWSPSGDELAAGDEDGKIHIWDSRTGDLTVKFASSGGTALSVSWSPSGRELATGSVDGKIRVWEGATGTLAREFSEFGGSVLSVSWSPSGRELASGSADGALRVWNGQTGQLLAAFSACDGKGLARIPGGWFAHSPATVPLDPHLFRLFVAKPGPTPARGWRVLPLGGLGRYLESPERVRASLAGERQPPVVLPGPVGEGPHPLDPPLPAPDSPAPGEGEARPRKRSRRR